MASTRTNAHTWVTAYEVAPPVACATLRVLSNTAEYGLQCVFSEEDGDPLPNSINSACLPWAAATAQATSVFYSPAASCPMSWTAVATRTAAEGASDWVDGETAIDCCPSGFLGGANRMCNPWTSSAVPVVVCGEADAEENENKVYIAGQWPADVSATVTALQLRHHITDLGLAASATGSKGGSSSTDTNGSNSGGGSENQGGLSMGAKAAVGTVIPLLFILGALAAFLLWRRKKQKALAAVHSKDFVDEHEPKKSHEAATQHPYKNSEFGANVSPAGAAGESTLVTAGAMSDFQHETPEWNTELDATESERRRYIAVRGSLFPGTVGENGGTASPGGIGEASELCGIMRVNRKPVPPAELDSMPLTTELDSATRSCQRN